jgi:serine/threonine protein kinase
MKWSAQNVLRSIEVSRALRASRLEVIQESLHKDTKQSVGCPPQQPRANRLESIILRKGETCAKQGEVVHTSFRQVKASCRESTGEEGGVSGRVEKGSVSRVKPLQLNGVSILKPGVDLLKHSSFIVQPPTGLSVERTPFAILSGVKQRLKLGKEGREGSVGVEDGLSEAQREVVKGEQGRRMPKLSVFRKQERVEVATSSPIIEDQGSGRSDVTLSDVGNSVERRDGHSKCSVRQGNSSADKSWRRLEDTPKVGMHLREKHGTVEWESRNNKMHNNKMHNNSIDDNNHTNHNNHTNKTTTHDNHLHDNVSNNIKTPTNKTTTHTPTHTSRHNNDSNQTLIMKQSSLDSQAIIRIVKNVFEGSTASDTSDYPELKTSPDFYRVERQIGKGCFGVVYKAEQILTGLSVALKVISKKAIRESRIESKIHMEIEVLKRVAGESYLAKLLEVFEDERHLYLVLEYLPNGDLISFFKSRPLYAEEQLKPFFGKIVLGTYHLHQRSVIHRDIKMDNVLLDCQHDPILCDYGISTVFDSKRPIKDTGGTPAYLAPEVIKAEGEVCFKSDVWSLGVLLFALTFGVVPFEGSNVQQLYRAILVGKFKFPKSREISSQLKDLVLRMLDTRIERRLSIEGVLGHPWFEDSLKHAMLEKNEEMVKTRKADKVKKDKLIRKLNDFGFPIDYTCSSVKTHKFNHVDGCYRNLMKQSKF